MRWRLGEIDGSYFFAIILPPHERQSNRVRGEHEEKQQPDYGDSTPDQRLGNRFSLSDGWFRLQLGSPSRFGLPYRNRFGLSDRGNTDRLPG